MTTATRVPYSYLGEQFGSGTIHDEILRRIGEEMKRGYYTLGPPVQEFEERFAAYVGTKHAIGVNSGTDALFLIMHVLGMGYGSKPPTYTVANTFIATAASIINAGGELAFVDIDDWYLMDFSELRVTPNDYVVPVHWGGAVVDIPDDVSKDAIIEDACQAIGAYDSKGRRAGTIGIAAAWSLHPLKNLNVMGDGGVVTTDDDGLAEHIRLLRNHGLSDRDTWSCVGYNSRLDTIQAIVGNVMLDYIDEINAARVRNAQRYDEGLRGLPFVTIPPRTPGHVYHLYQCLVDNRDAVLENLQDREIEAKIHYKTALHKQPAIMDDFKGVSLPRTEHFVANHITLPVHQALTNDQIDYVIQAIHDTGLPW